MCGCAMQHGHGAPHLNHLPTCPPSLLPCSLPSPDPPSGPPSPPLCCQAGPGGIKLYKFLKAGTSGSWSLVSSAAQPRFYDINEDNRGGCGFAGGGSRGV